MTPARVYAAAALTAIVVYAGALANGYVLDDISIIVRNPIVQDPAGFWRAFLVPYWESFGGGAHRPLAVATYWADARVDGAPWFHLMNLLWHAGATVAVTALARRWVGLEAALAAGLLFAVHPVHVEAVANIVGRAELMAALFACLAVYAALVRGSVAWSAAALVGGLLSKESAAVVAGLVAWGWLIGIGRPSRRKGAAFVAVWLVVGAAYAVMRWSVLHPYERFHATASVFVGEDPISVRLTAVAALADVLRLLVFPLHLRADYSPAERTIVHSPLDPRFLLGLACLALWATLLVLAWRRRRMVELLGLGWVAIAFLPVANLLFPVGILVAERTLYLPSVGLVLAAGASLTRLPARRWATLLGLLVLACGVRTAARVPVWRSDERLTLSILEDSPDSFTGPHRAADHVERAGELEKALGYLRIAIGQSARDARPFYAAADLAFTLGRPALADSMLARADALCDRCAAYYEARAARARARGDSATAQWLLEKARAWGEGGAPR
ncbi:MAG: hypothetical protein WD773_11245 [Gemmatimonadales bacterium]